MKSGKCPKCDSGDIYVSTPLKTIAGVPLLGSAIFMERFSWTTPKSAILIHYACASCNYIESYVFDDESMQNIKEEWKPINPKTKRKRKNDEG